ncbi:BZ3500_MvSof-1268-A1-R1_Chr4-2g07103 [Microbotryum saponariae]|uniref:BZ3500_MvSof-1268-A1-R1_Chr4-2g07103 protein n=1 Tax=Microbotryum saponariae TaxID=289078 RepID=A0A2X0LNB3_9BASI|nr:BZ3500_MvSof-1268-A1-R1_Chr4-2g07103 [Microbotryum saponariae]SDA06768.1 BZ3501_MvSof-1269-A2-R1_Chr4-2g06814 [Microbotryum saponariae]
MKGIQQLLSFSTLITVVLAGGSIDNSDEARLIRSSASTLSGNGNYVFENVATGQQLSFRRDSVTNFFPSLRDGDSLEVQFENGAARISGGNNKCASAQWSYDVEDGVDAFAVSYACAVGEGQSGTDTLEKTKQWRVADSSSSDGNDDDDDDDDHSPSLGLSLAAKSRKVTTTPSESATFDSAKKAVTSKANATTTAFLSHAKGFYEYHASSIPRKLIDQTKVIPTNRTTWPCIHPGWWLQNHPSYVTKDGHIECKGDLKAYRASLSSSRMARRSRIAAGEGSSKVIKRGAKEYYIITQDHLDDMATRAIGSKSVSSFGEYTSTNLVLWNKSDPHQIWTIVSE